MDLLRAHASTDGYKDKVKAIPGTTSQTVIVTSNDNKISLGSNKNIATNEAKAICAETLQVLDCVQSNYSFASTNNRNEKSKQMFPDSKIAQRYRQGETKINSYTVRNCTVSEGTDD